MINPLDLAGPQFLAFYTITSGCVLLLLWIVRSSGESGHTPRVDTSDPYLIAYLRGGKHEALRVATVGLIDRGLLSVDEGTGMVASRVKPDAVRRPIEQALVEHFEGGHLAPTVFGNPGLAKACEEYERKLSTLGLVPSSGRKAARRTLLLVALAVLIGLSVAKLVVALSRGRTNVMFLIVLTIVATVIAVKVATPRRTARGDAVLADLRRLFKRLRARASSLRSGGADADAALLAAVFGLAALPSGAFGWTRTLYPKASSSSGSSDCGSSCGSSCGGGGDGGGCGGCGGGGGD